MICTVCDVWYDPQTECDHRVIAMNIRDGFVKVNNDDL